MNESTKTEIKNTKKVKTKWVRGMKARVEGFEGEFTFVEKVKKWSKVLTPFGTVAMFHENRVSPL